MKGFFNDVLILLEAFVSRRKRQAYTFREFGNMHKDLLVIIADPKTDLMYVSYRGQDIYGKIGTKDAHEKGVHEHIVRDMLKHGSFQKASAKFSLAVAGMLFTPDMPIKTKFRVFFTALYDMVKKITYDLTAPKKKIEKEYGKE